MIRQRGGVGVVAAATILATVMLVAIGDGPVVAEEQPRIVVLSGRADLVSGGDALVEIQVPPAEASDVLVHVDGRDVTDGFALRDDGRLLGLVAGLEVGDNVLTATLRDGRGARLTLSNHPIGGPLISGPQVQPWVCTTEENGLGPHTDEQCNAPPRIRYFFMNAAGEFLPYDPASPPPDAAIATTTTDEGKQIPYIVREEVGTQNRGIYALAVLFDPHTEPETPTPWSPPAAWNRKVLWVFGGGGGPHHLQEPAASPLDDHALSRGFMVATSSLNVQRYTLNNNVQAESVMMLKEHIVETYGEIRRTIGEGCSGGSIQQHMIASMYPGLLDGVIPSCSFPDTWTQGKEIADCYLTQHYFDEVSPQLWPDPSQQAAVQGKATTDACRAWNALFAGIFDPGTEARPDCGLPEDQMYDAETNPNGVRCSIQDYQIAIWGDRAADGFAKRPLDNVGVQYGLEALRAGDITPEQFVDLNEKVGSLDIDFDFQSARAEADPGSIEIAYRTSQVTDARQLADVPILDLRGHSTEEVHETYNSYEMRARLDRDNGHHGNHVIWTGAVPIYGDPAFGCGLAETGLVVGLALKAVSEYFRTIPGSTELCTANPLAAMDEWLDAVEADPRAVSRERKVVENKPPALVDTCFISGQPVTDQQACETAYPATQVTPHMVAGEPLTHDVLKCRLRPPRRDADYGPVPFTDGQWARLTATFPDGVCDWSAPGVDQQPSVPWQTFADGPGGRPLGDPPSSEATASGATASGATASGARQEPGPDTDTESADLPATGRGRGGLSLVALLLALAAAVHVRRGRA